MSESQNYEEVTVASHGITVIKTFEEDAFPVPAIAFRIQSDRTESVTVRLVDDVPEGVAVEDLGFHPEYGSEFWTIEDDEITFEREIESEEQYTTVYGIRATGTDNVEQFLTEPTIDDVDPPLEDEDGVVGGSGSDVVRDVISGNADSVPGLEDEDEEDLDTLDLNDPNEPESAAEAEAQTESATGDDDVDEQAESGTDTAGETAEPAPAPQAVEIENVAATLANEIRQGNVDDDDLEVLKDELDVGGSSSVDARIERLQTEIGDLQAYTDALEEFLDENGQAQELVEDVQGGLEDVRGELDDIRSGIDENADDIDSVEDGLEDVEGDMNSLKADIKDFSDDIEQLREEVEDVEDEITDLDVEDKIDEIEDDIVELKEWREQLSNVLGAQGD